jgi:hypothetical protein
LPSKKNNSRTNGKRREWKRFGEAINKFHKREVVEVIAF